MGKYDRLLLAICLAGLLIRLVFIFSLEEKIYWSIDGTEYDLLAKNVMQGKGYVNAEGEATAYRPVGYPLFLAVIYLLCGHSITAVRIVQSVMTTALILVAYRIALQIFDRKAARIAALFCAIYPYFVYISGVFYPTALVTLLLAVMIHRLLITGQEPTVERFAGIGCLIGALILIRPNFVAVLPAFMVWYCFVLRVRPRASYRMLLVAALAAMLCLVPWASRNYYKVGRFTISTNGGRNFWLGNNTHATPNTGNEVTLPPDLQRRLAEASSEVEREDIYYAEAKRFIRENPGRFLRLTAGKAVVFWRLYPLPSSGFKHNEVLSKTASIITFTPILLCALLGFLMFWRKSKVITALFVVVCVSFNVVNALFISIVRLRLPIDTYLILFASYGTEAVWERVIVPFIKRKKCKTVTPSADVAREIVEKELEAK